MGSKWGGVIKTASGSVATIPANTVTTIAEVTGLDASKTYMAVAYCQFNATVAGTKPCFVWRRNGSSDDALHTIAIDTTGTYYATISYVYKNASSIQIAALGGAINTGRANLTVIEIG